MGVEWWHIAGKKKGVEAPITEQVYMVLYKNKNPKAAVMDLMRRKRKEEKG